ncbi:MAG: molybdenum ABC transporter ATP-binding protein [Bacteriovoracaceae bacterium]|jgi:molybdate transport system ATP-binding protein|nr:molybdenum ABC transporter ATP-binding protein [Bacteriovoracaceae bacterium]
MSIEFDLHLEKGNFSAHLIHSIPLIGATAIFGPSGCGKTTFLKTLAGLESGGVGFLKIGERVLQDSSSGIFVPTHKREMGKVFQRPAVFPHLSVLGNIKYSFDRSATKKFSIDEVANLVGLDHLLERSIHTLSGGEKQRVGLAMAIISSPKILLLDEPFTGLDEESKAELFVYLEKLKKVCSIPIILVTHSLQEVAKLCDHLVLMENGSITASGELGPMIADLDYPQLNSSGFLSIINTTLESFDEEFQLSNLKFSGGSIWVPKKEGTVGDQLKVLIRAGDVSLTTTKASNSSILNIFEAEIKKINSVSPAQDIVEIEVGGISMLASITKKSSFHLSLEVGKKVFAQVKSVGVL